MYRRHQDELDRCPHEPSRLRRLCELNVSAQVASLAGTEIVRAAWARGQDLVLHGWIYDLENGLLRGMKISRAGGEAGALPGGAQAGRI